ncbi:hypothetical protein BDAP_000165 [Binucleata daphniae]
MLTRNAETMPRVLVLKNIDQTMHPSNILQHINYGDIENYTHVKESQEVHIEFFSYLDLYLTVKDLQEKRIFVFDIQMSDQPNTNLLNAYYCGGTRILRIQNAMNDKKYYETHCTNFGAVEKVIENDGNIEIRFLSILSAIKFARFSFSNPEMKNRLSFGPDPCSNGKKVRIEEMDETFYTENRTVYLGGIKDDITTTDLFEKIKGGNVFSLKIIEDKKCAFLVFYDVNSANAFIELYSMQDLIVNNHKIKVSRGTETKIPFSNILMAYAGATRVAIVSNNDGEETIRKVKADFGKFGEIESVKYIENKNIMFVNFINMYEAYACVNALKNDAHYKTQRVGYGKDKCNNENAEDLMKEVLKLRSMQSN